MTRSEFVLKVEKKGVPPDVLCFDYLEGKDDVFFIRNEYGTWKVSYIERGEEINTKEFSTESDALTYLFKKL